MSVRPLSHSAIQTFRACQLQFAYKYAFNLPTPSGPAAELGSVVHAQLEAYLSDGLDPLVDKAGKLATMALPHFPPPGSCVSEAKVSLDILPGVPFIGYVDAHWYVDGVLHVSDLKTTSNYVWAKTAEQLATDPQLATYVKGLAGDVDAMVMHVQVLTKGTPDARLVGPVLMKKETVQNNWTAMQEDAKLIVSLHSRNTPDITEALDPLALVPQHQPNFAPCSAYGGCTFRSICKHSDINYKPQRSTIMAPTPAQLARRAALLGQPAPVAQPVVPPDATNDYQEPITEANGRISVTELRPGQWRAYLDGMTISKNGVNSWPTSDRALEVARASMAADDEVNGNAAPVADKPKRTRRTKAQMAADAAQAHTKVVEDGGPDEVSNNVNAAAWAAKVTEADVAVSKDDILADAFVTKAEEAAAAGVVSRPANSQPATPAKGALSEEARSIAGGLRDVVEAMKQDRVLQVSGVVHTPTLYVSCLPTDREVMPIEQVLAPLEDECAHEARVPYYGMIGYGAGPKQVIGKLLVLWRKAPPKDDAFIGVLHAYAEEVIAQWQRAGGKVVRGVR